MSAEQIVDWGIQVGYWVLGWISGLLFQNAIFEYLGWHKPAPEHERVES